LDWDKQWGERKNESEEAAKPASKLINSLFNKQRRHLRAGSKAVRVSHWVNNVFHLFYICQLNSDCKKQHFKINKMIYVYYLMFRVEGLKIITVN
jgi:hypothetical protein